MSKSCGAAWCSQISTLIDSSLHFNGSFFPVTPIEPLMSINNLFELWFAKKSLLSTVSWIFWFMKNQTLYLYLVYLKYKRRIACTMITDHLTRLNRKICWCAIPWNLSYLTALFFWITWVASSLLYTEYVFLWFLDKTGIIETIINPNCVSASSKFSIPLNPPCLKAICVSW